MTIVFSALCALSVGAASAQIRRADELDWRPAPADLLRGAEVAVLIWATH